MTSQAPTLSKSLYLIFNFFDLQTTQVCRLVNKEWREQVEKHYQLRELKLYKDLYKYTTQDLSELNSEDFTKINKILLDVSKSMFFFRKSTLCICDQNTIRVIQSMNRPPKRLEQLVKAFVALTGNEQTLKWAEEELVQANWVRFVYNGVNSRFKEWPKFFIETEFLPTITLEKIDLAQKYLDEGPIQVNRMDSYVYGGDYWLLWVMFTLECAKRRLALSEYARTVLDNINKNASLFVREELVKMHKVKKMSEIRRAREQLHREVKIYRKRIEKLDQKVEEKDPETLNFANIVVANPERGNSSQVFLSKREELEHNLENSNFVLSRPVINPEKSNSEHLVVINKKTSCCGLF